MRATSLLLPVLAARALSQVTVTEYVTAVTPAPTSANASASIHRQAVSSESQSSIGSRTFATSTSTASQSALSTTTSTETSSTASTAPVSEYSSDGNAADTAAGASGSDGGSFSIRKGGIIAIAVVVSLVAIFGIASTMLFVVAKRRQWTIRETMSRASKAILTPLTPRSPKDARGSPSGSSASTGQRTMHAGRLATLKVSGQKRDFRVGERQRDVEKGVAPLNGKA